MENWLQQYIWTRRRMVIWNVFGEIENTFIFIQILVKNVARGLIDNRLALL